MIPGRIIFIFSFMGVMVPVLAAISSIAGAATATGSSFGTGLYGSASLNFETNKNSMSLASSEAVASNIFGNNLSFTSGNNMTQQGSNITAKDTIVYDVANDLNVLASTDTYRSESGSEHINAGVSVGNNAVQISAGYNQDKNKASGTTHNNSTILADNIVIKTGNDATFAGANVNATESLDMDIGGDLNVESLQDSDYAKGSNWGVNASFGVGYGLDAKGNDMSGNRSGGAGFNVGSSNHDSAWVGDITELTGGNVNINVKGKTTITGAMIAAGNYDENGNFVDNGQLEFATNDLEYKDLQDFNTSNERGFGISTSLGGSTDKGKASLAPQGTTTISAKSTGSDAEQITHATIGMGNITVGGNELDNDAPALSGLNRDISNTQEITKELITGALDGSVTIDNRILTESGRAQIAKQHEDFVDNIEQIGDGLRNNIVTKSIENAITDKTKDIFDTVGDYIEQDRQVAEMQQKQRDVIAALNGATNLPPEQLKATLQEVADFVAGTDGFTGDLKLANIEGNVIGFAYQSNDGSVKNITLDLANIDMTDPNALMKAVYHETTNFEQHTANEQTAVNRGNTGAAIFDLKNYGNENTNTMDNGQWLSNYGETNTVQLGNSQLVGNLTNNNQGKGVANAWLDEDVLITAFDGINYGLPWLFTSASEDGTYKALITREQFTELEMSATFAMDGLGLANPIPGAGGATRAVKEVGKAVLKQTAKEGGEQVAKQLSKQEQKAIKSLEKQIQKHEQKLADFKKNPTPRPGTEKLSKEIQQKTIDSRMRHLEKEINTFKDNINKIKGGAK